MKINEALIAKIQKLLALAESPNENEAKAAAEKAQALLVKYNLDIQSVQDAQLEYIEAGFEAGKTFKFHQEQIISLLQTYFFVRGIKSKSCVGLGETGRRVYAVKLKLVGTPTNVTVANYFFDYLNRVYLDLWEKYRAESGAGVKAKKSYFVGLTNGLSLKLEASRKKVEDEAGLVLIEDPALKKYIEERTNGTCKSRAVEVDREALNAGMVAGAKINLSRPVEYKGENNGFQLEYKGV